MLIKEAVAYRLDLRLIVENKDSMCRWIKEGIVNGSRQEGGRTVKTTVSNMVVTIKESLGIGIN